MGRIGLASLLIFAAITGKAHAQEVPRYDPAGWCKRVSDVSGGSEWLKDACFQQEQTAYNKLKPIWSSVPQKTRGWCDQVAKSGGRGSYVLLEQCIDTEFASKQQNENSKFKF